MSHILLVEDELPFRRIITLNLAQLGCSVAEADSVENACEMALAAWEAGFPFDLIILETHLAMRCGWDLLRLLRAPEVAGTGLPMPRVIIMSALLVARSRTAEFAPVATLLKPFPISALMRLVERCAETANATPARGA
ncbi:MAG TPA: response regulator [Ktedonobacterales bacterium]|jgi:CheY-like chemotaxis protein|nr:response regulator [Ktedonobacterales bacterium]